METPAIPLPFQLSRLITSYWIPQSIHAAAVLGVADVLAGGPKPSVDYSPPHRVGFPKPTSPVQGEGVKRLRLKPFL